MLRIYAGTLHYSNERLLFIRQACTFRFKFNEFSCWIFFVNGQFRSVILHFIFQCIDYKFFYGFERLNMLLTVIACMNVGYIWKSGESGEWLMKWRFHQHFCASDKQIVNHMSRSTLVFRSLWVTLTTRNTYVMSFVAADPVVNPCVCHPMMSFVEWSYDDVTSSSICLCSFSDCGVFWCCASAYVIWWLVALLMAFSRRATRPRIDCMDVVWRLRDKRWRRRRNATSFMRINGPFLNVVCCAVSFLLNTSYICMSRSKLYGSSFVRRPDAIRSVGCTRSLYKLHGHASDWCSYWSHHRSMIK